MNKIIVCRHGKPNINQRGVIQSDEFEQWWRKYTGSGVDPLHTPSYQLVNLASDCVSVVSSALPRAIETAKKTLPSKEVMVNPLFNEVPIYSPTIKKIRMSASLWCVLARLLWCFGFFRNKNIVAYEDSSDARQRARDGVSYLTDLLSEGSIFLVSHSWFIRMMHDEFIRQGYVRTYTSGDSFWMWRVYERKK